MNSDNLISKLEMYCEENRSVREDLESSLTYAKSNAEQHLNSTLFSALKWPANLYEYTLYLTEYARWAPDQTDNPAWTDPETGTQQEVYDRLCHFYWLINQKLDSSGRTMQSNPDFSQWMVEYARCWGEFLNTEASFSQEQLDNFRNNSPLYQVENSMIEVDGELRPNNPSGWKTFNQFFARRLNPGLRPITSPTTNTVITCPADCTYRAQYKIGPQSEVFSSEQNNTDITLKKTHSFGNITDLLAGSPYADMFANGTFVHYFLAPYSYHHFHCPVAGELKECRAVHGKVYMNVVIDQDKHSATQGQFDAPDNSTDGYEFAQARGIVVIDTSTSPYGDIGLVAVVPVGMAQVSSVQMVAVPGTQMQKGEEFGYFMFGGSDIIVLYQEGAQPDIYTGDQYRHVGTQIAQATKLAK
ncbi:phosphatidylserine decarboxylase [Thaumasiovibrio subtropicus]|uniref:phosphatidylserine decarboxylase n=1 Tax=Thaumasiovibrio subtropicus TaxID=1891207 RepID=UPI00192D1759|nr:phosphatidylserine decarboxylase [Thaumasiovibrio subtropicus]